MATKLESILNKREYILYEMSRRHAPAETSAANPYVSLNSASGAFNLSEMIGSSTLAQLKAKLPSKTRGYLPN